MQGYHYQAAVCNDGCVKYSSSGADGKSGSFCGQNPESNGMSARNETCYGFDFITKNHDAMKVYTCSSGCVHLHNEYTGEISTDCNYG